MTDEKFAEFLQKAAADYRRPPATPREEIWSRIEATRTIREFFSAFPCPSCI